MPGTVSTTLYKNVTNWEIDEDESGVEEETGKNLTAVRIGEELYSDNTSGYILEDFYEEIYEEIQDDPSVYQISVQPGHDPQAFIMQEGRLVIHNYTMQAFRDSTDKVFNSLSADVLAAAYTGRGRTGCPRETRSGTACSPLWPAHPRRLA